MNRGGSGIRSGALASALGLAVAGALLVAAPTAQAGGAALWLYAPTRHDANRLLRLLADYHVAYVRHDGNEGVRELTFDAS